MSMNGTVSRIPAELKNERRWLVYRNHGNYPRSPVGKDGKAASTKNESAFMSYEDACDLVDGTDITGVGFVFGNGYVGVDLDACVSEDGNTTEWADDVLGMWDSYSEVSVSGTGIKTIAHCPEDLGEVMFGKQSTSGDQWDDTPLSGAVPPEIKNPEILVKRSGFFALTGDVHGTADSVRSIDANVVRDTVDRSYNGTRATISATEDILAREESFLSWTPEQLSDLLDESRDVSEPSHRETDGSKRLVNMIRRLNQREVPREDVTAGILLFVAENPDLAPPGREWDEEFIEARIQQVYDSTDVALTTGTHEFTATSDVVVDTGDMPTTGDPKIDRILAVHINELMGLTSECDLVAPPEPEYILQGMIARGCVTNLVGRYKSGKSTWLRNLLSKADDGGEFMNRPVAPFRALLMTEEGKLNLVSNRIGPGVANVKVMANVSKLDNKSLADPAALEGLKLVWKYFVDQHNLDMIVIDTSSRLFPGDENSSDDMNDIMAFLKQFAELANVAVVTIGHTGHQGNRQRGSSAIPGGTDFNVSFTGVPDNDDSFKTSRTICCSGRFEKYMPRKMDIDFDFQTKKYIWIREFRTSDIQNLGPQATLIELIKPAPGAEVETMATSAVFEKWTKCGQPLPRRRSKDGSTNVIDSARDFHRWLERDVVCKDNFVLGKDGRNNTITFTGGQK